MTSNNLNVYYSETGSIELNNYKYEPTLIIGKPKSEKVLEYRFEYLGGSYIVDVEIDFQNVPLIFLYVSDDSTLKHAGDSGENLYLVFNKKVITKDELIEYCNKYLLRNVIFFIKTFPPLFIKTRM